MLNLTRYPGQSIVIGDNITVTVTQVRGRQVCLGIEAPKDVPVHRDEVAERIKAGVPQNKA